MTDDRYRRGLLALSVALLGIALAGCAAGPPLLPIGTADERWQFNGFSVVPPAGPDWHWVGREGQNRTKFFNATRKGKESAQESRVREIITAMLRELSTAEDDRRTKL